MNDSLWQEYPSSQKRASLVSFELCGVLHPPFSSISILSFSFLSFFSVMARYEKKIYQFACNGAFAPGLIFFFIN